MSLLRVSPDIGLRGTIMLFLDHHAHDDAVPQMRTTPEGMLIVHAVMDRPIGEGSLVEVVLLDPWRGASPDIQEYDLASLGEVEDIHGPFCNPPRWMVSYKGNVSADCGDRIQSKMDRPVRGKGSLVGRPAD
jgi:hypothetical protein